MKNLALYRAWDVKNKKMFDVCGFFHHKTNKDIICVQGYHGEEDGVGWYNKEDIILMPYLNMQGLALHDIVEVIRDDKSFGKNIYEIEYDSQNIRFNLSLRNHYNHTPLSYFKEIKIIGNRWENPELRP